MGRFVAWLAELSPLTVYFVVGLLACIENIFPPTPSDFAVALGGFLTQQSGVSPVLIWLVAWLANLAGALAVYLAARRFGRGFLGSRLGRRLLPADAIIGLERGYLRFGTLGIFAGRFLPGLRSFIVPFVGLVDLSVIRAFVPMALASAIWYGILVWAGMRVGAEWEAINRFLSHLNRGLAIAAAAVVLAVGYWVWRRARAAGPRRRRLLKILERALGQVETGEPGQTGEDLASAGAAALLHELTHADPALSLEARTAISDFLRERWGTGTAPRGTGSSAQIIIRDTAELATIVAEQYDLGRRQALAERLYRIAMSDGTLSQHEEQLMRRAGDLLGLSAEQLEVARKRVAP
jgi:membrane protein DedA with SNARE-associated domain